MPPGAGVVLLRNLDTMFDGTQMYADSADGHRLWIELSLMKILSWFLHWITLSKDEGNFHTLDTLMRVFELNTRVNIWVTV